MSAHVPVDHDRVAEFCRKHHIRRLALFGSVLRDDFRPDSDVDMLVEFSADADWSVIDHYHMENELVKMLGREVDLVSREAVEESPNWIRRRAILGSAETIYAA